MGLVVGPLHVRRSTFIEASPEKVWKEFTTFERISRWLNLGHTLHVFEPERGGRVDLSITMNGAERHYGGFVLVYDEAREVSFENNWFDADRAWAVPTFWTYRLTALYGGTLVEFYHHGFERLDADAADSLQGYEQGWDVKHLAALRKIIEGEAGS